MAMRELLPDNPEMIDYSLHVDRNPSGQIIGATIEARCNDDDRLVTVTVALNEAEFDRVARSTDRDATVLQVLMDVPDERIISVARP